MSTNKLLVNKQQLFWGERVIFEGFDVCFLTHITSFNERYYFWEYVMHKYILLHFPNVVHTSSCNAIKEL